MSEKPERDLIRDAREEAGDDSVDPVVSSGESSGDVIGRYHLLERLGEGGMGTVWLAEQSEPIRRRVALKIIKLGMDTGEVIARFEAERQALALMDHPHIARVYDGGATENGRPYFVMELVKGVPITDYCDKAKLGLRDRLRLFAEVCRALQHAHQKGVIHRDVKPSNVLVAMHDGDAAPKVIDFGIAKAIHSELTQKTLFTRHARIVGTPEYMAPEQADRSGLDIDTRADVYSLGVLLYELLTGTKPFRLDETSDHGTQEMLRAIIEEEPERPSTRVSTLDQTATSARQPAYTEKLAHRLRGELDWIILKALEKDRTRRYETASSFADDIERYLADEPVTAGPPSRVYRLRKMIRRHRSAVLVGGVFAVVLVGGAVGSTVGWLHVRDVNEDLGRTLDEKETMRIAAETSAAQADESAREAREAAEHAREERRHADEERRRARMVADLLKDMLVRAGPLWASGMDTELLRTILDDMGETLFRGDVEDREVARQLHGTMGDTYRDLHMFEEAERHLRRAIAIAEADLQVDDPRVLEMRTLLARLHVDRFQEYAALDVLSALDRWADWLGPEHEGVLTARLITARALANAGELQRAKTILEELSEIRNRTLGGDHPDTVSVDLSLVWTRLQLNPLEGSEDVLLRLVLAARADGKNSLSAMLAEKTLARLYYDRGRRSEAKELTRNLVGRAERSYGPGYRLTVDLQLFYATVLHETGDTRQSDRLLARIIEEGATFMGADSPGVRAARLTRGMQLMANGVRGQRGALERAREVLQENMDQKVEAGELNVPLTRQTMMMVCAFQEDFDCVDELLTETRHEIDEFRSRFERGQLRVDSPTFIMLKMLTNVGLQYCGAGRHEDGEELLEISLPIKRALLGDVHPFTRVAARELAQARDALGRREAAADAWAQYYECAVAQCEADPSMDAGACNELILQMMNSPHAPVIFDLRAALRVADLGLGRSAGGHVPLLATRVEILVRMEETDRAVQDLERIVALLEGRPDEQETFRARLDELR